MDMDTIRTNLAGLRHRSEDPEDFGSEWANSRAKLDTVMHSKADHAEQALRSKTSDRLRQEIGDNNMNQYR